MTSIRFLIATAAMGVVLVAPAFAQGADPLCATLDKVIAAGGAATPFVSLSPNWAPGTSSADVDKLPGLEAAKQCSVYLAGTAKDGVVGGGEFNYFKCTLVDVTTKYGEPKDQTAAAARTGMASRVQACLAPKGWKADALKSESSGIVARDTQRFFPAKGGTDIVVVGESLERGRDPAKVVIFWTARLEVRTPNPKHPGSQAPR